MLLTVRANWALLIGIAFLMLGHGLQSSLLGVRANLENFPTAVTGLVMSGYSVGFLISAILIPKLLRQVGHVRVFAALAAMASSAILVHAVLVEPVTWFVLRLVSGVCMSGVFIVAESWLNASTSNAQRGQLLSVYMVVQLLFWAFGQLLLNIADPMGFQLFITVSVLVSVAVVPLLLSSVAAPIMPASRKFTIVDLYRISPLGCLGMCVVGFSQGAFFTMGAVFAQNLGMSIAEISILLAATTLAGMFLQWPIGWLSDHYDRRTVLMAVTMLTALSLAAVFIVGAEQQFALTVLFALYGGLCLPMYSLCIAHTNDYLDQDQIVGASGALVFASGLGNMVGPLLIAVLMQAFGNMSFVATLAVCHAALGLFALYRSLQRDTIPLDERGAYVYVPPAATSGVVTAIAQETAVDQEETQDRYKNPTAA